MVTETKPHINQQETLPPRKSVVSAEKTTDKLAKHAVDEKIHTLRDKYRRGKIATNLYYRDIKPLRKRARKMQKEGKEVNKMITEARAISPVQEAPKVTTRVAESAPVVTSGFSVSDRSPHNAEWRYRGFAYRDPETQEETRMHFGDELEQMGFVTPGEASNVQRVAVGFTKEETPIFVEVQSHVVFEIKDGERVPQVTVHVPKKNLSPVQLPY